MDVSLKTLFEKLRRIEALHAGATTPGERHAAENAMRHIRERLARIEKEDPAVEYKFTMADSWSRKLFMALVRRYGLHPFRYRGQRHTTLMVRVPKRFVDGTLWPEFQELVGVLRETLDRETGRIIGEAFQQETAEAEVRDDPRQVGPISDESDPG